MEYLSLNKVSKSYGDKLLLDQINLIISKGEKIGLIARNGSGKSTLLRILTGQEKSEGESSWVRMNQNIRLAYLAQEPKFVEGESIMDSLFSSSDPAIKAIREYEIANRNSTNHSEMQAILDRMDELQAWGKEAEMKEILSRFKLNKLDQLVQTLSGGELKRLALARLILQHPDFLILDEPTNHLDISMIEWLETYLSTSSLSLLMVTHDRYFLDRVCNVILELDKGKLITYRGNYTDYLQKKAVRLHQESISLSKTKKLYLQELQWINKQPKARGTKAKSRISRFDEIKNTLNQVSAEKQIQLEIEPARLGKKILEFYDVCMAYDEKIILDKFGYKFQKGEKLGICGSNGSGKSTFAGILTGDIAIDNGKRVQGETVVFGSYSQENTPPKKDKRVVEIVRDIAEYVPLKNGYKLSANQLLELFLFERKHQQIYYSQLSGGEKKRLQLLTVLMSNPNFLILDEPTNDLDILTLNVLEQYLLDFPGCTVIISHDRYFLDKLVDHLFIFTGQGQIVDYNGTYSSWKENNKVQKRNAPSKNTSIIKNKILDSPVSVTNRKLTYLEKKEMKGIENRIVELTDSKELLTRRFEDSNLSGNDIVELSKELSGIQSEIDNIEIRWLELAEFL